MILIIDMNSNELASKEFIRPLTKVVKNSIVKNYKEVTENDIENSEKIILSGAPIQDNEFVNNIEKFKWIKTCNKPILGICAGMQIISLIFGSELENNREIGMVKIETTKENKLFFGEFEAYELHNSSVKIPENFELLAKSENCTQAIKHNEIYGILFHPEVRNQKIVENFIHI